MPTTCPKCGEETSGEESICLHCHTPLDAEQKHPDIIKEVSSGKRIACSDGNCTGIIGTSGHCQTCGKPYAQEEPSPVVEASRLKSYQDGTSYPKTNSKSISPIPRKTIETFIIATLMIIVGVVAATILLQHSSVPSPQAGLQTGAQGTMAPQAKPASDNPELGKATGTTLDDLLGIPAAKPSSDNHEFGKAPAPRGRRYSSSGCESGHWVESVSNDGQIVKLEDGSIWEVDAVEAIDSALWLPTTDIVACDDKLINTDDNETVSATRIR